MTFAQITDEKKIESLLLKLSEIKIDTVRINTLNNLAFYYRYISIEKAQEYANKALNYSKKINFEEGISQAYSNLGMCYGLNSDYIKAINYFEKAIKIAPDKITKAKGLTGLGVVYTMKSDFAKALEKYNQALKLAEDSSDKGRVSTILFNIGNVYFQLKEYNKAIEYYNKEIKINKNNKSNNINNVLCNIGLCFLEIKKYDDALIHLKKVLSILENTTSENGIKAYCLSGIGECYFKKGEVEISKQYFEKAILLDKEINDDFNLAENIRSIGIIYVEKAKKAINNKSKNELLNKAISNYTESISLSLKVGDVNNLSETYYNMSEAQSILGKAEVALESYKIGSKYKDSIFNSENKESIKNLEDKRIIDIKNKEIQINKLTITNKSTLNKVLIGSSIVLLLLIFLGFRNFKNKQKIQNLKIKELEKDKQLFAIDAMLKGQEEERSRIAKDLHDGLGGLLSGTKLSFTTMKENLILTPEDAIQFDKSLSMLDNTINDLRKVAHNLMPEALVKFGLTDALKDFCGTIQSASGITINYQKIGDERKIVTTAEVFIYRIIQELVNNAVKHSKAKEIIVQLAFTINKIIITVEDDGIGYDLNLVKLNKGSGLQNIEYRVDYFNGTIDTITSPNNGTSVTIELNA